MSERAAHAAIARLEDMGLVVQQYRSARRDGDPEQTIRLPSVYTLSSRGAALVREADGGPARPAGLDARPLGAIALLTEALVDLLLRVPHVDGLWVAHGPAVNPERRQRRAARLAVIHQAVQPADLVPRVWLAEIDPDPAYRRLALLLDVDDGATAAVLTRRGQGYGTAAAWQQSTLGLVPRPVWLLEDPARRATVVRGFGGGYRGRVWYSATAKELLEDGCWRTHTGAGVGTETALAQVTLP